MAITFDACATKKGWYGFDRDVFEILKREQIPATVFVSGRWVDTHPEAMADLDERSGWSSSAITPTTTRVHDQAKIPAAKVGQEIDETEAVLGRYGRHSVAFRLAKFGDWDRRTIALVGEHNLPTVTWDVVSGDPSLHTTTAAMIKGRRRAGPHGLDHHLSHQRARGWKTQRGAAGYPERAAAPSGFRFVSLSTLMHEEPGVAPAPVEASAAAPVGLPLAGH